MWCIASKTASGTVNQHKRGVRGAVTVLDHGLVPAGIGTKRSRIWTVINLYLVFYLFVSWFDRIMLKVAQYICSDVGTEL